MQQLADALAHHVKAAGFGRRDGSTRTLVSELVVLRACI
jgi:hypothetical protein